MNVTTYLSVAIVVGASIEEPATHFRINSASIGILLLNASMGTGLAQFSVVVDSLSWGHSER